MNKMYHAISADAFKKLQFQAGALLKKFDPAGATPVVAEDLVCLTSGGISVTCKPNAVDLGEDLDEVPENTYQLKHITSWDCGLSTTCMTVSADTIKLELGAADVETNKITVREDYEEADFQDIWWHGNLIGGGYAAVKLMKAASDGGLELKTNKDGKGNLTLSLKGHYDMKDTSKVPMEFYVKEGE
nr:MAG TPA: major tail protein [Caudoviricetes sp.]